MRRTILMAALLALLLPAMVMSQQPGISWSASRSRESDNSVACWIKYVGTEASATVQAVAISMITMSHGAASAEVADTTIDSMGFIDPSAATGNTWGEIAALINASANWECVLGDVKMDADSASAVAQGATNAKRGAGVPLYLDTSVIDAGGVLLTAADLSYSGPFDDLRADRNRVVGLSRMRYLGVHTVGATPRLDVYRCVMDYTASNGPPVRLTEALVFRNTSLQVSGTEEDYDLGAQRSVEGRQGEPLLLWLDFASTGDVTSVTELSGVGYSRGGR